MAAEQNPDPLPPEPPSDSSTPEVAATPPASAAEPVAELPPPEILPPAPIPLAPATPPRPPWNFWDVLAILGVTIVGSWIAVGIAIGFRARVVNAKAIEALGHDPLIVIPAQAAAYALGFAFMIGLLKARGLKFWQAIEWRWPQRWLRFALAGVGLSIAIQILTSRLPVPKQLPIDLYFTTVAGAWAMAIFGTLVAPFIEELFFRGFLYPVLERWWGISLGTIVTAALFALIHGSQLALAWAPLLMLFLVGLVLTTVRVVARSVAASFLVHMFYNGLLFTLMFFATDHFHDLDKLGR